MVIKLELQQEEAQKILDCLVKEPYIDVVDLINKIQNQAAEQLSNQE